VARCQDFFDNLALRLMVKTCSCCFDRLLGGEACSTGSGASLHTLLAKLMTASATGVLHSEKMCKGRAARVPLATVTFRKAESQHTLSSPWTSKRTTSREMQSCAGLELGDGGADIGRSAASGEIMVFSSHVTGDDGHESRSISTRMGSSWSTVPE